MIDLKGFFADWDIDDTFATVVRGKEHHQLYVAKGFAGFVDVGRPNDTPMLDGLGFWLVVRLWRELQRERRRRSRAKYGHELERIINWKAKVVSSVLSKT